MLFAAGLGAGLAAGFAFGFGAGFAASFAAGFARGFGAGFATDFAFGFGAALTVEGATSTFGVTAGAGATGASTLDRVNNPLIQRKAPVKVPTTKNKATSPTITAASTIPETTPEDLAFVLTDAVSLPAAAGF